MNRSIVRLANAEPQALAGKLPERGAGSIGTAAARRAEAFCKMIR